MATYGTLAAFATTLGEDDAVVLLLEKTLAEEKETDTLLTEIACNTINFDADNKSQNKE
ncbi:DUF892 family protein [Flavobacterium sp.]|uniref:DUF892 family protein n=1 Tax=Flavobacterium sp. TaxID=239 RepID=UPI00341E5C84